MMKRADNLSQELKAWAANELQVTPECTPAEARAAFLRLMRFDNGVINLGMREAMLLLTGRARGIRPTLAMEAVEQKIANEVEDFAHRFFTMPLGERRAEWARLRACGQGFPRVDARLAGLKPGLDVTLPKYPNDEPATKLAETIGELFVLRSAARAARRQSFLEEARRSRDGAWARAARTLQSLHPVAELDPEVLSRLCQGSTCADQKELNRNMRKADATVATVANDPGGGGGTSRWPWAIVVVIGLTVVRLLASSRTPPAPNVPPPAPPQFNRPDFNKPQVDINEILRRARERKDKKDAPPLRIDLNGRIIENPPPDPGGGDPEAVERLFGKDAAKRPLDQSKDKDKRDPP
ncbi:MAG TPA: hypothetical protein VFE62_24590 [Gemmataceae bacterium]|nr:hypothetical protein [Gemmataceae bacterium]